MMFNVFHPCALCSSHLGRKLIISDCNTMTWQHLVLTQVAIQLFLYLAANYVHLCEGVMFLW